MKIRYNNLFKLLIDKGMNRTELGEKAGLTPGTIARLSKNKTVSLDSIIKICEYLDCRIEDVVEIYKDNE